MDLVDRQLEILVLGLIANNHDVAREVFDESDISPDHFADEQVRRLFEVARDMWGKHRSVGLSSLAIEAMSRGVDVAADLIDRLQIGLDARPHDWPHLLDRLQELMIRRRVANIAFELQRIATQDGTADSIQDRAEALVLGAFDRSASDGVRPLSDVIQDVLVDVTDRRTGHGHESLPVGFGASLDRITGGFEPGELILVAGRPGMGKTALTLAMAANVARRGRRVLYCTLEMRSKAAAQRVLAQETPLSPRLFRQAMPAKAYEDLTSALDRIARLPIDLYDRRGITIQRLLSVIRAWKARNHDGALVVVDRLGLIRGADPRRDERFQLADNALRLREVAGQLEIPVVLVHQLNRGVEARPNKRPLMSDLRESGEIEEHADFVLLLYRHSYYHEDIPADLRRIAEVIIAKGRDTGTGTAFVEFVDDWTRFQDADPELIAKYQRVVLGARGQKGAVA